MAKNISKRAGLLMDMHEIVTRCCEDENFLDFWFTFGCPDGMNRFDAYDIAECQDDEDYIYTMEKFIQVIRRSLVTNAFTPCDLK